MKPLQSGHRVVQGQSSGISLLVEFYFLCLFFFSWPLVLYFLLSARHTVTGCQEAHMWPG